MGKRALIGLVKGLVLGGAIALLLVQVLGVATFGAWLAYPLAALVGIIAGLVAGRPIWDREGRIEAGLKAVVGAIVGAGLMFALRKWLNPAVDLGSFGAGGLGELPVVSLPLIVTLLSVFYELDNTGEPADAKQKTRAEVPGKARVEDAALEDELEDEAVLESREAKRKG